jgi:predicted dehydrogenase
MAIRVGIAGIGFMGWIHWLAYQRVEGIEVVAIAEPDAKRRTGDWRDIRGNFGPPGEQVDLACISVYSDITEMLEDKNIDLVDVCLPPAAHRGAVLAAAAAGKHVFCEKPIALRVSDAEEMVAACEQQKVQLMVGHVLPFFPEYSWALEKIWSGKYGSLLGGTFKRVISNPAWLPHFFDLDRVGGPLLDLHVHDAHLIRLLFGMPQAVNSRGRFHDKTLEYAHSQFEFPNSLVVSSVMGVVHQQGRPFTHGFEIHLERATLQFESAAFADAGEAMPIKLIDDQGNVLRPEQLANDVLDGFVAEISEIKKSLASGVNSPILSGELARDAVRICAAQALSAANRRQELI